MAADQFFLSHVHSDHMVSTKDDQQSMIYSFPADWDGQPGSLPQEEVLWDQDKQQAVLLTNIKGVYLEEVRSLP